MQRIYPDLSPGKFEHMDIAQEFKNLPSVIRIIFAILVGVFAGITIINLAGTLSPYQPPPGADYTKGVPPYQQWMANLPADGFYYILAGLLLASLVAGFLSRRLSPPSKFPPQLIAGFSVLFFDIVKYLAFPNPDWVTYIGVGGSMLLCGLGGWLAKPGGEKGLF